MKLQRFIGDFDFNRKKQIKITDRNLLNQIKNVLRLKPGDKVILADGKLNEAPAKITAFEKDFFEIEVLEVCKNKNEPDRHIALYCSILKKENFELLVQKAAEIGVKEIVPLITERTVKTGLNDERLKKIIKEAAEQSGRGVVPILGEPMEFKMALKHAKENKPNLFFDQSGENVNFVTLNPKPHTLNPINLFIGPEGGWADEELKLARENGFKIITLGKLNLRAETAAIVASYLATNEM